MTVFTGDDPALPEDFEPYDVTCARCGRVLSCRDAYIEEGDEWECPACWKISEDAERNTPRDSSE